MLNKKFVMALVAMFFVFNSLEAQNYEKKVKKGELKVAYFASGCF